MASAASISILPVQCPSPFRLCHAFGDTPPGLETEQILRELARGKTERREDHANALLQVGTVHRELVQEPQSLTPNQEAVALLRALAASDTSQRGNLGRGLIGLGLSCGALGRLDLAMALNNHGLADGDAGRRQEALAVECHR